jgi:SAM-dependent methyltransferase
LSEVLEHVEEPKQVLEQVHRVLRPGGLLWATTPHAHGVSAKLLGLRWTVVCPPEHLQLFSRRGLRGLLDSTRFRTRRLVTEAFNPTEVLNALRTRHEPESGRGCDFDRVASGYRILQKVHERPSLQVAKRSADCLLRTARLGDNIRVWATK